MLKRFRYVFLITVDCLRADHVGCIGDGSLTPNIDKLARDGLVFTRAFANGPGTNQSFPAIFTSTYFLMHGGLRLLPGYKTLAEVMRENGFRTVGFHSNPFLSRVLGWNRGFEEYYAFLEEIKSPSAAVTRGGVIKKIVRTVVRGRIGYSRRVQSLLKRIYYRFTDFQVPYLEAEKLNQIVFEWVRENRDRRFFLWMHYMDPHIPLIPPERYLMDFSSRKEAFEFNVKVDAKNRAESLSEDQLSILKNLYKGEVRYVDESVGELLAFLEDEGILDDSLLFLMADHGHAFMEHQRFGHDPEILYNEVLHVPLLIYGLNRAEKVDFPVQLLDIPPTMIDVLSLSLIHIS